MTPPRRGITINLPEPDPQIIEVERALIGGCLNTTRGGSAWPTLLASEFYLDRHRIVWQAMQDLLEQMPAPAMMDVLSELRRTNMPETAGGLMFIVDLVEAGIHAFDLARYGRIVRESARRRAKIAFAAALMEDPTMSDKDIERQLRLLEAVEATPTPAADESFDASRERARDEPPLRTGLHILDEKTGGLMRGHLIALGGRTSHGKTAVATQIALNMAQMGTSVEYITLEDSHEAIYCRWRAQMTGVSYTSIRRQALGPHELDAVQGANTALRGLPLKLVVGRKSEAYLLGHVAASAATCVVIDHLQEIATSNRDRHYELDRILGRLAALAVDQRKVILLSVQLGRAMEGERRPPVISDLRDTGGTEQIARQVWLLYWPSKHDPKRAATDFELEVAKNTEGSTGRVHLQFEASCSSLTG